MKKMEIKQLDYLDSKELLRHQCAVTSQMRSLIDQMFFESKKQEIEAINQLVIDTAKERGCSIYDICFNTYPDVKYEYPEINGGDVSVSAKVQLVPMVANFGQGPGYWKKKYYAIKKEMQRVIDSEYEKDTDTD